MLIISNLVFSINALSLATNMTGSFARYAFCRSLNCVNFTNSTENYNKSALGNYFEFGPVVQEMSLGYV